MKGYVKIDWVDGMFTIEDKGKHWPHYPAMSVLELWETRRCKNGEQCYKENVSEKAKLMYALLK